MTLRFRLCLIIVAFIGLAVLGNATSVPAADERARLHRPAPPVPDPGVDPWTAHTQRVVITRPAKPRRPERLPQPKVPRLDSPGASSDTECTNLSSIPAPGDNEIIFVANEPIFGNNAVILRYGSPFDNQHPCLSAYLLVAFPEQALLFGADAALGIISSTQDDQTVYSFWGAEPFGLANQYFPDTGPNQFLLQEGFLLVLTPRELYAVGAACPHCRLGNIRVSAADRPTWNPMNAASFAYNRVHNLSHADLTGATLTGTFTDWDFTGANLTGANLTGAVFTAGTRLVDVNFSGATLDDAVFQDSDLTGASFVGAYWDPARPPIFNEVLIGRSDSGACTQLDGLDLLGVPLLTIGAVAAGCESVAMFKGSLLPLETVAPHLPQLDLSAAYVYVDATNRSALAGANLTSARLDGLTLIGFPADLTGAVFDGASMKGASFDLVDFAGATLHNVVAPGASFRGARFSAHSGHGPASFAGDLTNLTGADFIEADVSGISFAGATLTEAVFSRALAVSTSFQGVSAENANFSEAHIYGDGQAFHQATTLAGADFTGAVLAADVTLSGGFDFTQALLQGAKFDFAQCIGCKFTNAPLHGTSFTSAYLPGADFSGAQLDGASLYGAWLYCGDLHNSGCQLVPGQADQWQWPLELGLDEIYGPVPFRQTILAGVNLSVVSVCPEGKSGKVSPVGCDGYLLPEQKVAPAIPSPCSAAAHGSCPEPVRTLMGNETAPSPLALTPLAPAYWAIRGPIDQGLLVAFMDSTVRLVTGDGQSTLVAGVSGQRCLGGPPTLCGEGKPATMAHLGLPTGLAVDATGTVYIADSTTLRIQRIGADGIIWTVAGSEDACDATAECGDGGQATAAALHAAHDVWADPVGNLWIADGVRGIRLVTLDGVIHTVAHTTGWNVVSVTGDMLGTLYAATQGPDHLLQITHDGTVSAVVGTGTSGFNGNMNSFGFLLPGRLVQINRPGGLATALDGTVFFADTGNNLLRGYVPGSGHVIEVGGLIVSGTPEGGFNGDQQAAQQTQFRVPFDIATTGTGQLAVADRGNGRVRQFAR